MASAFENMMSGFQAGTNLRLQREEEDRRQKLNTLAQRAYGASGADRSAAIGEAIGVDAGAGMAMDNKFADMDQRRNVTVSNAAKMLMNAPEQYRPALYAKMRGDLAQYIPNMPEQYDATVADAAKSIVAAYGGGGEANSVQSRFINDKGEMVALMRDGTTAIVGKADPSMQIIEGAGGFYGVDRRNLNAAPVQLGGQPPAAMPQAGGLDPVSDFPALASAYDAQVTSLRRSPDRNARVGGVQGSYHLTGEAGDFIVPQDRKAAFIQDARSRGYQAIDEGDHIHVEPPKRGMTMSQFQGGQQLRAPEKERPTFVQMSADEVAAAGLPAGTSAQRNLNTGQIDVINKGGVSTGGEKPMPTAALKMIQEETNAANTAASINANLTKHLGRMESGTLDFGPMSNLVNRGLNFAGASTEESRNYQEFVSDLERLRNDSLRLNSGVQTDGDAQRAWNELFANLNDPAFVRQRLNTILELNKRAEQLRRMNVEAIRENYGRSEQAQPATQPRRLKFNQQTGRLE